MDFRIRRFDCKCLAIVGDGFIQAAQTNFHVAKLIEGFGVQRIDLKKATEAVASSLKLTLGLQRDREVVVALGQIRVEAESSLIAGDGFINLPAAYKCEPQVAMGLGVLWVELKC